jgi:hypothetical protein
MPAMIPNEYIDNGNNTVTLRISQQNGRTHDFIVNYGMHFLLRNFHWHATPMRSKNGKFYCRCRVNGVLWGLYRIIAEPYLSVVAPTIDHRNRNTNNTLLANLKAENHALQASNYSPRITKVVALAQATSNLAVLTHLNWY